MTPERPLAIGLNLTAFDPQAGGIGTYVRHLVPALGALEPQNHITCFVGDGFDPRGGQYPWAEGIRWVRRGAAVPERRPRSALAHQLTTVGFQCAALPLGALTRGLDVLHSPANVGPVWAPGVATVVTIHDLIWMHFPDNMSRSATLGRRLLTPRLARRSNRVLTVSDAARRDLISQLHLDPDRVETIAHGPPAPPTDAAEPAADVRKRFSISAGPVLLCVAQKRNHKNLTALVEALSLLDDRSVQLVLPGHPTDYEDQVRSAAYRHGVQARVHLLDWVTPAELEALYGMAACVVVPSLMEGFGLPVLEAMARGVPVACSDTSSLPEAAAGAAILFDPRSPAEMAGALSRVLSDRALAGELVRRGHARCAELSWAATARATLAAYRRAITDHRAGRPSRV